MTSQSKKNCSHSFVCLYTQTTDCYETRPEVASRRSSSVTATILGDATAHTNVAIPQCICSYSITTPLSVIQLTGLLLLSSHRPETNIT